MPLSPCSRLGPYEILNPLGAGGMGEVYRARDTRLDRTVAVKVLPAHAADNPEARQRFEREARAVSSLNHPHICALYDVGRQDGRDFLVMEYLEGETLATRLTSGLPPTGQTLQYAIQISGALAQAHRQGVFHRDLKPGNIMLTKAGAKLLDFGLAKMGVGSRGPGVGETTLGADLTKEGTILGTLQYMSPEQLHGQDADARSDLFSFGAVVYEMITGRKAFEGKSQASVIAAILDHEPPPLSTLQPLSPPALDRLVQKCLVKDPDERWQNAHDLKSELEWIATGGDVAPSPQSPPRPGRLLPWLAAALFLAVAAILAVAHFRETPPEVRPIRFSISLPNKLTLSQSAPVISPDGRRLAFAASLEGNKRLLWIRPLDAFAAQPLPGTEDGLSPFWSPDSRFIGYFAGGKLKKIDASGGPPQTLCDVSRGAGGTWNREGVIVFGSRGAGLSRVLAVGGVPGPLTTLDQGGKELSHVSPHFLPDGRHFLYGVLTADREGRADVGSLDSKQPRRLLAGRNPGLTYAPPQGRERGHLLFWREGTLMAQPFDTTRLELSGDPFPVAEQVSSGVGGDPSVSENGVLVYRTRNNAGSQLVWFDRTGRQLETVGAPASYGDGDLNLSPDDKRVAVSRSDPQPRRGADIWLLELGRDVQTRFTFHPSPDVNSVWSPDGSRIVFASPRDGSYNVYRKASSGAGDEELLLKGDLSLYTYDWSPDGRFLVYSILEPKTRDDLWVLPLDGDRKPIPFLRTEFSETHAQFSPDGRWVAYASDESGSLQIYVQPFNQGSGARGQGSGGKWQVSTTGGNLPRWRRDGKELYYLSSDAKLMAVDVKTAPTFQSARPRALFQTKMRANTFGSLHYCRYAVTADGQRFLMVINPEEDSDEIQVVLNWTAGAKK